MTFFRVQQAMRSTYQDILCKINSAIQEGGYSTTVASQDRNILRIGTSLLTIHMKIQRTQYLSF